MPGGTTITLDVEPTDSIENLKQQIEDREGVPIASQALYFDGTLLADGDTLADYNIQKGAILQLVVPEVSETSSTTTLSAAPAETTATSVVTAGSGSLLPFGGGATGAGVGLALVIVGAAVVRAVRRPLVR